jgi:hypothetical protein
MLAFGLMAAPAALFLLQLSFAPDEVQHSPMIRFLGLGVASLGGLLWLAGELIAAFSRE